jgi:hypothetical protein
MRSFARKANNIRPCNKLKHKQIKYVNLYIKFYVNIKIYKKYNHSMIDIVITK